MIISASRRTDLPRYYAAWFMQRIRAGYCVTANPFNPQQRTRVSLAPSDVEVIVFWTRDARPLLPHLAELDTAGYRYYFQVTLLGYPRELEPACPHTEEAVTMIKALAGHVGPDRVIWRYDPIVISAITDIAYHEHAFGALIHALHGSTRRCVVSLLDDYRKSRGRLAATGLQVELDHGRLTDTVIPRLAPVLSGLAAAHGMEIVSCAEEDDWRPYGIAAGRCVDDALIHRVFGIEVTQGRDPNQRPACGCVASRDIGAYDTCLAGCRYCYATGDEASVHRRFARHSPDQEALVQ